MKVFYKIVCLLLLGYCLYKMIEQAEVIYHYPSQYGYREGVFGYPMSLQWTYLVLSYWLVWVVGVIFIMARRRVGWLLLHPVAIMAMIYLVVRVIKEYGVDIYVHLFQLVFIVGFVVFLNHGSTFSKLGIRSKVKHYLAAAVIFVIYGSMFLVIRQYV